MLTVLDLFSGIGGISLGLESTGGFRTVAFCEIEPFPRLVLAKHWPGVPIHDDVRTLRGEALPAVDAIVGGFPCQDISAAGKGAGLSGARSGLWFEFARLVGELRPRWVLAENVGALRTRGVDRVCSDLEGEGYAVWPLLVGAWAVGAPHKRERVWIVAHRRAGGRGTGIARSHERQPDIAGGGTALAYGYLKGRSGERGRCLQHGLWAASWDHADGCGEGPVGEPTGSGLEGQRADAGGPQEPESRDAGMEGTRGVPHTSGAVSAERDARQGPQQSRGTGSICWPARPGEPQHEWEEPRLRAAIGREEVWTFADERLGPAERIGVAYATKQPRGRTGQSRKGTNPGSIELPLGGAAHGLSGRLVRDLAALHNLSGAQLEKWWKWWRKNRVRIERRQNREALKAYGNSVVPQVVAVIGRAILDAEGIGHP